MKRFTSGAIGAALVLAAIIVVIIASSTVFSAGLGAITYGFILVAFAVGVLFLYDAFTRGSNREG